MAEIKYEIVDKIAILSERGDYTKELNKISWNDRPAKFDIREWNHETERMGKGVTLTEDEVIALREALNALDL